MKKTMTIIIRLLSLPFIMGLVLIYLIFQFFKIIYNFILYGGEFMTYYSKDQPKTMQNIYDELKQLDNEHNIWSINRT